MAETFRDQLLLCFRTSKACIQYQSQKITWSNHDQVQACLPPLRKTEGTLIIISSGAAITSYSAWGPYGGSKAAINHLVLTLGAEEPKVTSIAFRPGVVDTGMQQTIRAQDLSTTEMDHDKVGSFIELKKSGKILQPDQPAHVIAKLVLEASSDLSGKFMK